MDLLRLLLLAGLLPLAGCGGVSPGATAPTDQPLTVEEWRQMAPHEKFEPDTLDRLKKGNPALQTPAGWNAFYRSALKKQ